MFSRRSNSFSFASIFIVGLLTEVLLCGLPARDDRLQEHRVLVLDERHQIHVVLALDDEDALAGVPVGIRVFQDVEQVATLNVEDDVLEPDDAIRLEFAFFASSQATYFTAISVALRGTLLATIQFSNNTIVSRGREPGTRSCFIDGSTCCCEGPF
jgi:hypothetical protein